MTFPKLSTILLEIRKGIPYLLLFLAASAILDWLGVKGLVVRYLIILILYILILVSVRHFKT